MKDLPHTRRQFLATSGAVGLAAPVVTAFGMQLAAFNSAASQSATGYKALVCIFQLGGNDAKMKDLVATLSDEALQPFAEGIVAAMVTKGIKPGQCKAIERATRLLSPLPPENTAEIVTFILVIADKPKVRGAVGASKKSDLPICPAA